MSANVLVLAGYGLNCEEETLHAFQHAGLKGNIIHINDLIENPDALSRAEVLAIPGGFSYGDDTGSGNAFAQKMKLALWDHLQNFVSRDTMTIGICNGCQILINLGLVPAINNASGKRSVAVTHNLSARYQCRWVDVAKDSANKSPWLCGIEKLHIPVAHGEGRFMMNDNTLKAIKEDGHIALRYINADTGTQANGYFPHNPNGAKDDIAALTDASGRILAIMPHPERGMFTWQRDDYMELKDKAQRNGEALFEESNGMYIFKNAALYFA